MVRSGLCATHRAESQARRDKQKAAQDAQRGSPSSRGYDRKWQALRAAYLAQHPLCECERCDAGALCVVAAQVVDHIVPISERPDLRLEWSNLRAMSKRCHDRHTARTQGFARRRTASHL